MAPTRSPRLASARASPPIALESSFVPWFSTDVPPQRSATSSPTPSLASVYSDDSATSPNSSGTEFNTTRPSSSSKKSKKTSSARKHREAEDKIKRPANPFIIFRSQMMGKMVGIEKDHRIISQILGKMWKRLSAEEKQPYIELAAQKKREHLERYPDYRFQPKPRTEQPKKRNVKRNTPADKQRFAHVADCLLQGKSGEEIVKEISTFKPEVEELDRERFNASPCFSDASRGAPSGSSPASDDEQPFRSPLLPPATEGSVHLLPVPELSSFSMHASIFDARPYSPTPDAGIAAVEQSMAAMGFRDPSPHDFGAVSAGVAVPEAALAPYPTASQPPAAIYVDAASYQYPTEAEMWFAVPEAFPQENASYDPMGMLPPPAQDNTCQWDYYGAQDMRQSQLPQLSQLPQPQALLPEQQTQMAMAFGYAQGIDNWTQPPVWMQ